MKNQINEKQQKTNKQTKEKQKIKGKWKQTEDYYQQ